MIKVYNKSTKELLGRIDQVDLDYLIEELEEEGRKDRDYYIEKETVDEFEKKGASPKLVSILRSAMRNESAVEIYWESDNLEGDAR